jgi:ABC-type transport system involved in multi-copper enzyme maturation permease subunit
MIRTVVKREFLDNILSFKFMACVLVAIIFIIVSTFFLADDYRSRLDDYNRGVANAQDYLRKIPVYSYLEVSIHKKPSPLSIFISGIERKTGNHMIVTHREIPAELKGGLVKNEFSQIFSFFDLSSIIIIIFTLLAILLSYESISAEREEGVLSLVLSNSVPRFKFLLGKYLGGLISLLVPLSLCFIIGLIYLFLLRLIPLSKGFFACIFLVYILAVLYLSSVLLIGIFVSSRNKASYQSLFFLLAYYLITVFLLPSTVDSYAEKMALKLANNYETQAPELLRERTFKITTAIREVHARNSWASMERMGERFILRRINPEETIEYYRRYHEIREPILVEYAKKIYDLRMQDWQISDKIHRTKYALLMLLPSVNFEFASERIAGTGRESFRQFYHQTFIYWHQLLNYLKEKNAFSLRYFYPYSDALSLEERALISEIDQGIDQQRSAGDWKKLQDKIRRYDQKDFDNLNLADMPVFHFQETSLARKIQAICGNILILIIYNILFFVLAHLSFNGYDPRIQL